MNKYRFSFIGKVGGGGGADQEAIDKSIKKHDTSGIAHTDIRDLQKVTEKKVNDTETKLDNELLLIASQFQKTTTDINKRIALTEKGIANGVATLDAAGLVPLSQINLNTLKYKGAWDASKNIPIISNITGTKDDFYIVSVDGEQDLGWYNDVDGQTHFPGKLKYEVGSNLVHNGFCWEEIKVKQKVLSVNGKIGDVVIDKTTIGGLENVDNTSDLDKPLSSKADWEIKNIKSQLDGFSVRDYNETLNGEKTFKSPLIIDVNPIAPPMFTNSQTLVDNLYVERSVKADSSTVTEKLKTPRSITVGAKSLNFDGSVNINFTAKDCGFLQMVILGPNDSESTVPVNTLIFRKA